MDKTYKIVKIIDEYRVVVNAGSNDGISSQSKLEIYVPGEDVTDPETGETLGALDYVKAKLEVVDVFPKMCVCENQKKEKLMTLFSPFDAVGQNPMPLNVNSMDISGGYEGIEKKIKVGDLVRRRN